MAWAIGTDRLRRFVRGAGVLRAINRAGGATIAVAGVASIFARRPVS